MIKAPRDAAKAATGDSGKLGAVAGKVVLETPKLRLQVLMELLRG
ncbi:hypothetical protein QIA01_04950 (plasmid) [Borreliella americana]